MRCQKLVWCSATSLNVVIPRTIKPSTSQPESRRSSGALKTFIMCMCVAAKKKRSTGRCGANDDCCTRSKHHAWTCVQTPRKRKIPVRLWVHRNHHNERCSPVHCSGAVNPYLHFSDRDLLLHRKPDFFELFEVHWQYFLSTPSKCFHFLRAVRPTSDVFSLVTEPFLEESTSTYVFSVIDPLLGLLSVDKGICNCCYLTCSTSSKLLNSTSALLAEKTIAKAATS